MKCYEYFDCKLTDCPMFQDDSRPCWEQDNTLCNNPCKEVMVRHGEKRIEACKVCCYYRDQHRGDPGGSE